MGGMLGSHICSSMALRFGNTLDGRLMDCICIGGHYQQTTTINTNILMSSFQDPQTTRAFLWPKKSLVRYPELNACT